MNFSNNIVKYTTIFIGIGILYYLLSSYLLYGWPVTFGILYLAVYIYLFVMFGREERAARGDVFPFAEAFKSLLIIMVVSALTTLAFQFIWVNLIDPSLPEELFKRTMESTAKTLESFGASEETIESTIASQEGMEDALLNQYTAMGLLKASFWVFLASALFSAIIAFFIKKEETFA